jgi:hypothetical protein
VPAQIGTSGAARSAPAPAVLSAGSALRTTLTLTPDAVILRSRSLLDILHARQGRLLPVDGRLWISPLLQVRPLAVEVRFVHEADAPDVLLARTRPKLDLTDVFRSCPSVVTQVQSIGDVTAPSIIATLNGHIAYLVNKSKICKRLNLFTPLRLLQLRALNEKDVRSVDIEAESYDVCQAFADRVRIRARIKQ